jgi:protein-S-isoprenylcysteine O-methyltransferase Ste14
MRTTDGTSPAKDPTARATGILRRFGQVVILLLLQAVILFLSAGRLSWLWAWLFLGINLLGILVNGTLMLRLTPNTVAERGKPGEMESWDKTISGIWSLVQFVLIPLVAGLDERLLWAGSLSTAWHMVGVAVFLAGFALFSWAMISNAYFSTVVRIQSDRGHTVCRTGPYQVVRHPGYVGAMLQSLGMPLLLGSMWAFVPGIVAVVLMFVRTHLEDRMLRAELLGYSEYAGEVRFRLIPGVW